MQTQFDQLNSKTLQVYKLTLIAPENEPSSVSTARQKSSSSDAETFLRPACCLNVTCQQKGRTKHLLSLSKMKVDSGQTCLIFESTSRDEAAIGQLKIGVLLHDVICEVTSSSSIFLFFTFQNFVSQ